MMVLLVLLVWPRCFVSLGLLFAVSIVKGAEGQRPSGLLRPDPGDDLGVQRNHLSPQGSSGSPKEGDDALLPNLGEHSIPGTGSQPLLVLPPLQPGAHTHMNPHAHACTLALGKENLHL